MIVADVVDDEKRARQPAIHHPQQPTGHRSAGSSHPPVFGECSTQYLFCPHQNNDGGGTKEKKKKKRIPLLRREGDAGASWQCVLPQQTNGSGSG